MNKEKFNKMKKEEKMEKKIVLKKEREVVLFVKERQGIKLVNLDLSKHIMLNEPIQEIKIKEN